jgi:tetratricopeptide (TPR) repeat protein
MLRGAIPASALALVLLGRPVVTVLAAGPTDAGQDAGVVVNAAAGSSAPLASPDAAVDVVGGRRDPAAAERHWTEGLARFRADDAAGAISLLRQAAAEDPGRAAILTDLGYALARAGERASAEALYRRAILIEPERVYAYANLAELLTTDPGRWSRQDEILALLGRGLRELDDRGREALALQIARFEASVGRTAEARRRLTPLVAQGGPAAARAQALLAQVGEDERAQQDVDWPDAEVPASDRARLEEARRGLDASGTPSRPTPPPSGALALIDALVQEHPGWIEARWQRARALEALGRIEPARAELAAVVRLQPSRAEAWRRLGVLLVERDPLAADEALRHALALRPGVIELRELRRRLGPRVAEARGRTVAAPRLPEPTPLARRLHEEAQTWSNLNAPEMAGALVDRALAESPAFLDAAALAFGLRRSLPTRTIDALAENGEALWQLVERLRPLDREGKGRVQLDAWRDRAIAAGVAEARYARAVERAGTGAKAAALDDLRAYLATPSPAHAAEARALGRSLLAPVPDSSPAAIARRLLVEDRAREALAVLGAPCRASLGVPALLALADVHEHADEVVTVSR